jgi:hypothetical protein
LTTNGGLNEYNSSIDNYKTERVRCEGGVKITQFNANEMEEDHTDYQNSEE